MTLVIRLLRRLSGATAAQPEDPGMGVKMSPSGLRDLDRLMAGEPIDESQLDPICEFVDVRHDCADFRVLTLLLVAYSNNPHLSDALLARVRRSILGFRYWMDEAGEDSMCFWSENHQVIFGVAEYLAGQLYPDTEFTNPGPGGRSLTGTERMARARRRLMVWLEHRFRYGFTEWASSTYYEEDAAALAVLADLADDLELAQRATMVLDLLVLDLALHRFERCFVASGGRTYERQKKDPRTADVIDVTDHAFGVEFRPTFDKMSGAFVVSSYEAPEVLRRIAAHPGDVMVRETFGLDLDEVVGEVGPADEVETTGLFFWLMEAFTTPEAIGITMDMIERWRLHTNRFLEPLGLVRKLPRSWLPGLVRFLNPATQGVAIRRANVQTWRTANFLMSSAQGYHPGGFGDQQHLWQLTLPGGVPVFAVHPGAPMFDDVMRNFSPASWVGNGINPQVGQDRNVLIALHDLRFRGGLFERKRQEYSHLYWPIDRFDEHAHGDHPGGGAWLVARSGNGYVGVVTVGPVDVDAEPDAVVQRGDVTGWVVLAGSAEEGTFPEFTDRVRGIHLHHTRGIRPDDGRITTLIDGVDYELRWDGGLLCEGVRIRTDYPRFDTPFVRASRNPDRLRIEHEGHVLELDWEAGTRWVGTVRDTSADVDEDDEWVHAVVVEGDDLGDAADGRGGG